MECWCRHHIGFLTGGQLFSDKLLRKEKFHYTTSYKCAGENYNIDDCIVKTVNCAIYDKRQD